MSSRLKKVSQTLQQHLAEVLHTQVSDPRLSLVSITEVSVTPDLRNAHVYYHVIGLSDEVQIAEVEKAMQRAAGFCRSELARKVTMKFLPALHFHYDDLSLKSAYMDQLIESAVATSAQAATTPASIAGQTAESGTIAPGMADHDRRLDKPARG